jgi:uncharacterized protein (TIRG00374 family)
MTDSFRLARFWFQLALTGGFIALLAWRVNIGDALATFPDVDWVWVVPGLAAFTGSRFLHALRWRVFLRPERELPWQGMFGIFLVGNMANITIPLRAGDLLRVQVAANRYSISRSELTATVFVVETLLDGLTFVVLVAIAFGLGQTPGVLRATFWGMAGLALFGLALGVGTARFVRPEAVERMYPFRWLSPDIRARASRLLAQFLEGMETLRNWRLAGLAFAYSLPGWLLEAVSYWFFGHAFGLGLDPGAYLILMMTANFAVSIPLTPSGIGPYEVAVAEVAVLLGADRALATGFAIGTHLCFIVWIVFTGLVAMWLLKLTPQELFTISQEEPPAGVSAG